MEINMKYELTENEKKMSADELYGLAVNTYIGEGEKEELEARYEAYLRAAIDKSGGEHLSARLALAEHLSHEDSKVIEAASLYAGIARKHGDARAAYKAGRMLYYNVKDNESVIGTAIELFRTAAEGNLAEAIVELARHYRYFAYDDEEGQRYAFSLLCRIDDTRLDAIYDLTVGRLYALYGEYARDGIGTECDPTLAFECFEMAVRRGEKVALSDLGECYFKGFGTECDLERALECFMETKHLGVSKYYIAMYYLYGLLGMLDEPEGVRWLKEAVEDGDGDAMYELATAMLRGTGTEQDLEGGIEMMKRAFDEGANIKAYEFLHQMFPEEYPMG